MELCFHNFDNRSCRACGWNGDITLNNYSNRSARNAYIRWQFNKTELERSARELFFGDFGPAGSLKARIWKLWYELPLLFPQPESNNNVSRGTERKGQSKMDVATLRRKHSDFDSYHRFILFQMNFPAVKRKFRFQFVPSEYTKSCLFKNNFSAWI